MLCYALRASILHSLLFYYNLWVSKFLLLFGRNLSLNFSDLHVNLHLIFYISIMMDNKAKSKSFIWLCCCSFIYLSYECYSLSFLFLNSSFTQYIATAVPPPPEHTCQFSFTSFLEIHCSSVCLQKRANLPGISTQQGQTRYNKTKPRCFADP